MIADDGRTTTQIYKDEHGNYMTRVWYMEKIDGRIVQKMREEPTEPSQIRHTRIPVLFVPTNVIKKERETFR